MLSPCVTQARRTATMRPSCLWTSWSRVISIKLYLTRAAIRLRCSAKGLSSDSDPAGEMLGDLHGKPAALVGP
jgi:hypothetical protein